MKTLSKANAEALQVIFDCEGRGQRGVGPIVFGELNWPGTGRAAKQKRLQAKGTLTRLSKAGLVYVNRGGSYQVSADGKIALKEYRHAEACAQTEGD